MSEATDGLKKDKGEREGVGEFIRKTREELNTTTFPSSDDVRNTTLIVLVSVVFFSVYLFGIDHMWAFLLATKDGFFEDKGLLVWLVNKVAGL